MSYRQISQKEARRLKARVDELEQREALRFASWCVAMYPGGIHLMQRQIGVTGWDFGRLQTARRLGCALVVTVADDGWLNYYAVQKKS